MTREAALARPSRAAWHRVVDALAGCAMLCLGVAGFLKLVDLRTFAESLQSWQLIPGDLRVVIALVLPFVEFCAGMAYFLNRWKKGPAFVGWCILGLICGATTAHLLWSVEPTCRCFGALSSYLAQKSEARAAWWVSATLLLFLSPRVLRADIEARH